MSEQVKKQVRDGSATIRRAKMMLVKAELTNAYKSFVKDPSEFTAGQLATQVDAYLDAANTGKDVINQAS